MQQQSNAEVGLQISEKGIYRVVVFGDDASQERDAHLLLAKIAPELRALDAACKKAVQAGAR
jgi:hypothetical protein